MSVTFLDNKDKDELLANIGALSKEDVYESIETININEDIQKIERTAEPNGNDYKFKNVLLRIAYQNTNHVIGKWARATYTLSDGKQTYGFLVNASGTPTGQQIIKLYRENGYTAVEISGTTTNWGNIINTNSAMRANQYVMSDANVIGLAIDRENAFMTNDTVEIWGVRA